MLVIHPKDKTTAFLSKLYEGMDNVRLINEYESRSVINKAIRDAAGDRIMILGHGCPRGLFWREDDSKPEFDKIIVGHQHAYNLREHGANIFMLSCYANEFAEKERIKGFYTGMIISELQEANDNGVETTKEEIEAENLKLVTRLRQLLDSDTPLSRIPNMMHEMNDSTTPLAEFNYANLFYR